MWLKKSFILSLALALLLSSLPCFSQVSPLAVGEPVTQETYDLVQNYIRILLSESENLRESLSKANGLTNSLQQNSATLNSSLTKAQAELLKSKEELSIVRDSLTQASKSVEILEMIADLLGISSENLQNLLPLLKQQVEDWQTSLELKEKQIKNLKTGLWVVGSIAVAELVYIVVDRLIEKFSDQ